MLPQKKVEFPRASAEDLKTSRIVINGDHPAHGGQTFDAREGNVQRRAKNPTLGLQHK